MLMDQAHGEELLQEVVGALINRVSWTGSGGDSSIALVQGLMQQQTTGCEGEGQQQIGCEGAAISDHCMTALHSIFQQNLVPALDLVERGRVTKYVCSTGPVTRKLYVVQGSTGNQYVCLTTSSYCSCPSYVYNVLVKGDALLCKHQLAVRLATSLGTCEQVEVSREEWATLAGMDTKIE